MIKGILFFSLFLCLGIARAAIDSLNLAEYQELCKFIQILEAEPEIPKINFEGFKEDIPTYASELLSTIELLNASTTDDGVFELLEKGESFEGASANPVVKSMGDEKWAKLVASWKINKEKGQQDPTKVRRIPNSQACATAHRQIGKVLGQVQVELDRIQKLESLMKTNVYAARRHMYSAIYGVKVVNTRVPDPSKGTELKGKTEVDPFKGVAAEQTSFGDGLGTYAKVCGGDGTTGKHPGTSIISDMTCLCASKAAGNNGNYCGAAVTSSASITTDFLAGGLPQTGNDFKGKCSTGTGEETKVQPSAESLHGIVTRFRAMLGKNTISIGSATFSSAKQKFSQFILGAFVSGTNAPQCEGTADLHDGQTAQKGICVNYGALLTDKKMEIPWIAEILKAADKLKENEKAFAVQLSLLRKIEHLKNTAEFYYDNALNVPGSSGTLIVTTKNNDTNGKTPVAANERDVVNTGKACNYAAAFTTSAVLILLYY